MNKLVHFPNKELIREQAATWITRMDRGLTVVERAELQTWLNESSRHRAMLLSLADVWDRLDMLNELSELFPREAPRRLATFNLRAVAATLACLLIAAIAGWVIRERISAPKSEQASAAAEYRTAIGEHRVLALADGSVVDLNTDSVLAVRYTPVARNVELIRGEAHFKVAKDARRVFTVSAGGSEFEAVGTAFNVRLNGVAAVALTVTEGRVKVLARAERPAEQQPAAFDKLNATEIMVDAGKEVDIEQATQRVEQLQPQQLEAMTAWMHGMIVFDGEPLEDVVQELARYSNTQFIIADDDIKRVPVAGYFKVGDIDALLAALHSNFNIEASRDNGRVILARGN